MTMRAVPVFLAMTLGLGASMAASGPAVAAPAGAQPVCKIKDDRLTELSGLAAASSGYVVVNDGADEKSHRKIFFLGRDCAVDRAVAYPSRPRDTEDLALAADGTVWVGDIGDNGENRTTIALWRLAPGSKKPALFRLTYPDGAHNAEALLLAPDGTPIVVTKTPGAAGLYVPAAPLAAGKTTALRAAGPISLPLTTTSNPYSLAGHLLITGGAVSPDGRHVVLRTYADAFEFDVPDGDVVRAVTGGTPRTIPLPDEPQGESIAYSPDGTTLLTVSEGKNPELLRYAIPDRPSPPPTTAAPTTAAPAVAASTSSVPRAASSSRDSDLPVGLLAAGALLVAGAGALALIVARRSRKARR